MVIIAYLNKQPHYKNRQNMKKKRNTVHSYAYFKNYNTVITVYVYGQYAGTNIL